MTKLKAEMAFEYINSELGPSKAEIIHVPSSCIFIINGASDKRPNKKKITEALKQYASKVIFSYKIEYGQYLFTADLE